MIAGHEFALAGARLVARAAGTLWWPDAGVLVVSDLHLGKSGRIARRGGALLPPYETADTLARLGAEIAALQPATVVCLGDTFDDLMAAELPEAEALWLARLMAGRRWIRIAGNHDPGPVRPGGEHLAEWRAGPLIFRHIAAPGAVGEVSGHYHPKARVTARGQALARPCFLIDAARAVLPAFGTYTGGLATTDPALCALMAPGAVAVLTGRRAVCLPMPRGAARPAGGPARRPERRG
ncbi:MAG: ligase-associated DNA damage response endonuclease PdeM [Defluviimonas sp.]|nr:ligase-associated DNA damage response endonuclease PdeM [Defluviimonas sp.]